jgi:putative ABC transport system ATP-binding protein
MRAAVNVHNVEFSYKREAGPVPVLRGATFSAARGEILMLSGPSGSGKTTLLSIVAGLLTPDSGSIVVDDVDVMRMSNGERARFRLERIGFVFQRFNLIGALSAQENIELVLRARGESRAKARSRALESLHRLGIVDKADRRPAQLSGGEQQRVAVARALCGNPAVIFADEPTSSLDAAAGATVVFLMVEIARERGATVLIASHDDRIVPYVDRVLRVEDGRC